MTETTMIGIGMHDVAWHDRFYCHVASIFGGIDFSRWAAFGGWGEGYKVLAMIEGTILLQASASRKSGSPVPPFGAPRVGLDR
jgi:hypothetical protein